MAGTGETSIRSYNFFQDDVIAGTGLYTDAGNILTFVDQDTVKPFTSHSVMLANDAASDIFFRVAPDIGGSPDHGRVKAGEVLVQDFRRLKSIYLKGTAGAAYRFWAW